jgi:hypothetical protein
MRQKQLSQEQSSQKQFAGGGAYPDFDGEYHVIGLRAVAAAVRYQGETSNVRPAPKGTARPEDSKR